jgi:hypothetical protein
MRCVMRGAWAAMAALALLAGTASAEKQWLQYRVLDDRDQAGLQTIWIGCATTKDAPAGEALPEFKASDPCFASWVTPMAPQGKVLLALDRSSKKGQYDLLYVDSNCSGSLRDKKPTRASGTYDWGSDFAPVKITFPGEDGPITYHISFHFRMNGASQQVFANSACVYEGNVRIGGKSYHCMLRDCNSNATFDDLPGSGNSGSDEIRLGENDKAVTYFAGKYLAVDGALYQPKPSRDGSCIEFEPAGDVAMGSVRAKNAVTQLSLGGENGLFHLADGAGSVPAGRYGIHSWKIERKGADNANWTLTAQMYGSAGVIEVKPGQEVVLDVGEPITCKLGAVSQGSGYQISETLCARLGENIRIERNDSLADAPRVRVTNKDGAFSKVYIAEYG